MQNSNQHISEPVHVKKIVLHRNLLQQNLGLSVDRKCRFWCKATRKLQILMSSLRTGFRSAQGRHQNLHKNLRYNGKHFSHDVLPSRYRDPPLSSATTKTYLGAAICNTIENISAHRIAVPKLRTIAMKQRK